MPVSDDQVTKGYALNGQMASGVATIRTLEAELTLLRQSLADSGLPAPALAELDAVIAHVDTSGDEMAEATAELAALLPDAGDPPPNS